MAGTIGEGTTQGLDDLNARCAQYKKVYFIVISSRFTKMAFNLRLLIAVSF